MSIENLLGDWASNITETGPEGRAVISSTTLTFREEDDQAQGESDVDAKGNVVQRSLLNTDGVIEGYWVLKQHATNITLRRGFAHFVLGDGGNLLEGTWSAIEMDGTESEISVVAKLGYWALVRAKAQ